MTWVEKVRAFLRTSAGSLAPSGRDLPEGERHIDLLVEYNGGRPVQEPVHAADLGGGRFRLLYSPGFLQGIAAGDEFRVLDEHGAFEVLHRSGNLAIQIFSPVPVDPVREEVSRRVADIDGVLDGAIERGLVFTVPVRVGFPAIEKVFGDLVTDHPGLEWYFGNVYDPSDDVTPLNWWVVDG